MSTSHLPIMMGFGLLLLGIGGAAFYGWMQHGSSILLSLAETGIPWCF
ncbi:hypothetical protein M0654_01400 [Rhizobium sp. NTR19]|uniref:Uncharacterized protein n=1 Tax=Neorhizobium turbinariae TaxID=2937795 RepID=A0ABT0IL79_9HYPH|nr:hypothetical protein [Neorhizobium turbinariae]MCK8778626.1 hypothetical protein [Neorhizobium turbinariae]